MEPHQTQMGLALFLAIATACGGSKPNAGAPASTAPPVTDAGDGRDAAARPFAATAIEAQALIQEQIELKAKPLWKCVDAYRVTKGDPHRSVTVDIGIDQEGRLLGVTTASTKQGDLDPTLKACLWDGLVSLPFPRSHAGIITVRQAFTDASVTP